MPARITESHRLLAISPHLDDVALSVGGIVARMVGNGADVVVGTVFTADNPHPAVSSPVIEELNTLWNLGPSPIAFRRGEDVAAVSALGARFIHGGLLDAIYRTDRERNCLYPTRTDVFSGPSHKDDIFSALNKLFADWIEDFQPDSILCPLAVGRHVDHVVTSESLRTVALDRNLNVFLYEDFPYSTGRFPPGFPDSVEAALRRTEWTITYPQPVSVDVSAKIDAILKYASQIDELFANARELEIALKRYMASASPEGDFCETIWLTST
ncbi:PIG-L deacetylase family protein [Methylocapsa sp. S129]|uniref:PIG-L deacetylase family protein n=1 Tax=Methylocapsa sp. S129 TaxID=1641869 RepID=UPI00131D43C6|nr:PIG-L family deacetylase [Methylocapsa sp. S129]